VLVYVKIFFLIFPIKVACSHFINLGPAQYIVGWVSLGLAVLVQSGCRFDCLPYSSVLKLCTTLTYLLTYILMEQSPPEKLTGFQLVKKFPTFYRTRRFITTLTSARHLSLSWTSSIQSIPPHPNAWRSILILSSHLCLHLPSGLFPHQNPVYASPLPPYLMCPAYLILLNLIIWAILGEQYRSFSSSLCSFLHSPVTLSLFCPTIFLSILLSNTSAYIPPPFEWPSFTPIQNTSKIIVLYIS